jgi:hypothetical protein
MQFVAQNTRAGGARNCCVVCLPVLLRRCFLATVWLAWVTHPVRWGRSAVTYIETGVQAMMCTAAKLLVRGLLLFFGMAVCLGPACASSAGGAAGDVQDQQVERTLIGTVPCAGC